MIMVCLVLGMILLGRYSNIHGIGIDECNEGIDTYLYCFFDEEMH